MRFHIANLKVRAQGSSRFADVVYKIIRIQSLIYIAKSRQTSFVCLLLFV